MSLLLVMSVRGGSTFDEIQCGFTGNSQSAVDCQCGLGTAKDKFEYHIIPRFGLDLIQAVGRVDGFKEARNVERITFTYCSKPMKIKLDFDRLNEYNPNVKHIKFTTSPVKVYLDGRVQQGDMFVMFSDISGSAFEGASVTLNGGIDFCAKPCSDVKESESYSGPPSLKPDCNNCRAGSNLHLDFRNVEHVLLDHAGLASYPMYEETGRAMISADHVKTFRVENPFLNRVDTSSVKADGCWLGSTKTECSQLAGDESNSSASAIVGAVIGVLILIVFVACVVFLVHRSKRGARS